MEKEIEQINDYLEFLLEDDVEFLNEDFFYQEHYFNSETFNKTFLNVEKHLNNLYEKTRVLQDVIAYSKEYISNNIYSLSDECKSILEQIEDNADSLRKQGFLTLPVPLLESTGSYVDRDGSTLPKYSIYNGAVTLSNKVEHPIVIKSISQTSNTKAYKSNLEDLKQNKVYRSYYILDNPIRSGLKEIIRIELDKETTVNQLDVVGSNCTVEAVKYINQSGTVDTIFNHLNVVQYPRKVKTIEIITNTSEYKKLTYCVNEKRISASFWDKIASNEYNKLTKAKETLSQSQIDDLAGITAYKESYEKYSKAIAAWMEERKRVADYNISNGYSDSVPKIDFIEDPKKMLTEQEQLAKKQEAEKFGEEKDVFNTEKVVQKINVQKQSPFPDSENLYYQTYNEDDYKLLSKTGSPVNYFVKLTPPSEFK